ncbi:hypothetical protein [Sandaracinus amylolyticus]|uniref:Uncharacterized protein n=1 Tax=Sandaracinus amylolyticus TaxID=927083 RepID=A0A0F6YGV6_9BACT|nr:hypothetical protein [Sandaracinus amylolyticus]AKF04357.1 hypothetical protein DB32_001506 [Sandaracinus amylolyticus]
MPTTRFARTCDPDPRFAGVPRARRSRFALVALALVASACSTSIEPGVVPAASLSGDGGVDDGGAASFLLGDEFDDPEVAACDDSSLGGACSGSREYQRHRVCTTPPNAACNGGYCEAARSCSNWAFGHYVTSRTKRFTQSERCEWECIQENPNGGCYRRRRICWWEPSCSSSYETNLARSEASSRGAPAQAVSAITATAQSISVSTTQRRCDVTISNVPYPNTRADVNVCGCATCRHATCGTEEPYLYQPPGGAAPAPGSSTTPSCVTAEDRTTVATRWARLRDSWSRRALLSTADRARVAARVRTMLELHADEIVAIERADAIAAYAPEESAQPLSCEPGAQPITFGAACSTASRAFLGARLAMCERVAQDADGYAPRARGAVAWVLAPECLATLEHLAANPSCSTPEIEARARVAAFRMIERGLDAITERPSALATVDVTAPSGVTGTYRTLPELARQLHGIGRWYELARASEARAADEDAPAWTASHLDRLVGAMWRRARAARRVVGALCPALAPSSDLDGDCVPDGQTAPDVTTDLAAALTTTTERADRLDRNVLLAAFQETSIPAITGPSGTILPELAVTGHALRGEALLAITADALRGSLDRVDSLSPYNQLACRLTACGGARASGVDWSEEPRWAQTWALLGSVDDAAELQALVTEVGPDLADASTSTQPESWQSVWERIARRRVALAEDVAAASQQSAVPASERVDLAHVPTEQLTPGARALASVITRGNARAGSYAATGLVDPTRTDRRLRTIVSADGRAAIIESAGALVSQLEAAIVDYEQDRRAVVSDLLAMLGGARALDEVIEHREELVRELERTNADHAALRMTLQEYERRYAETYDPENGVDLMGDLDATLDDGAFVQEGGTRHYEVRGFHGARAFPLRRGMNIVDSIARGIEIDPANGGEPDPDRIATLSVTGPRMIAVHAAGEYSPLCALRSFQVAIPSHDGDDGVIVPPVAPGTTIGPEGFTIDVSGSSAEVRRIGESTQEDLGLLGPACQIASVAAGGGISAGTNERNRGQAAGTLCSAAAGIVSWLTGEYVSPVATTTSAETSTSARFSAGLRLRDTPFPMLPAGALVVIEMAPGSTMASDIRDIHLLRSGASSFFVPDAADLYFVVNDGWTSSCGTLAPPGDSNVVSLELRVLQSETGVAQQVVDAMAGVLESIRGDRALIVEQGSVLSTQLSAYREAAIHELEVSAGVSLADVPDSVRNAFDAYVSYELARLELATEIRARDRRVQELQAQLQALDDDLLHAGEQGRITALLPVGRLRNLDEYTDGTDEAHLRWLADSLTALAVEDLVPLIELWHPDLLPALVSPTTGDPAVRAALGRLASPPPTASPFSLVDDVALVVRAILSTYAATPMTHVGADRYVVGISFGRPGYAFPPEGFPPDPDADPAETPRSVFPRASSSDAARVWGAVFAATALAPSDVRCTSDAICEGAFDEGVTCDTSAGRCRGPVACVDLDGDGQAAECSAPGMQCVAEACVRGETRARVALQASDLYRALGGAGGHVACQSAAPIVQRSALVFALGRNFDPADAEILADMSTGRRVVARIDAQQPFALRDAETRYTLLAAPFLERTMPLVYTTYERVIPAFTAHTPAEQGHRGSSVLAPITVDFSALSTLRAARGGDGVSGTFESSELLLVMEIDAVPSTRPTWITTCAP